MAIKQIKLQMQDRHDLGTVENYGLVVQVDGVQVYSGTIIAKHRPDEFAADPPEVAVFDLDLPTATQTNQTTVKNFTISVTGSSIWLQTIFSNFHYRNFGTSTATLDDGIPGSSVLFWPDWIVSQPIVNGTSEHDRYNINTYIVDGKVTGMGTIAINEGDIVSFDVAVSNWNNVWPLPV